MSRLIRSSTAAAFLVLLLSAGRAWAENEGQDDLDRATETKLTAKSLSDLAEVIRLCQSALEKGLDKQNTEFANDLLASTLIQRGVAMTEIIFKSSPPDRRWPQFRHVALTDLEKALKLNPKQPQALYCVARLNLLPGGDVKRAGAAAEQALDLSADEPLLRAKVLVIRASIEKDPEKKLADLDEAVRIAPRDDAALRARALVRTEAGKLQAALDDLGKAIELAPKQAATYELKAIVLVRLKKYDEALASLDKARKLKPDSAVPLIQKARVYVQKKDFQAALTELDVASSIEPANLGVLLLRAGIRRELGEGEKALADVDRVLKIKPELYSAMRMRAGLLADIGKTDQAIAELEKLRKLNPEDLLTLLQLGMLYSAEKKSKRAVDAFSTVLAEKPDILIALRGRGDSLLNLGKHAEAVADYDKALKLKPKDAGILNNLAWVLATSPVEELRDGRRAVELATEACELTDYKQPHILSTLAAAYAETGDFDTAVKWAQEGIGHANEKQKEPLGKELQSYREKKPWREPLSEVGPNP